MTEITVSQEEYSKREGAWQLLDAMLKNPKTRTKAREAIKELKPDVSFPEDIADPMLAPLKEQISNLEKSIKDERQERSDKELKAKIDKLRKDYDFTDEGIDELIKLMKERNVGDPEVAAIYIKSTNQKPVEIPGFQPSGWQLEANATADESMKGLLEDPESWADREAAKVVNELRSGKTAA